MSLPATYTRRDFLQTGGVAAATLALSPVLAGCGSGDYEAAANAARQPIGKAGNELRELVRLATLAPSGHNTQPWKFRLSAGTIQLFPDLTRRVPVVDPADRELWMSLGGALENLLVAAAHLGYRTETTYHLAGTPDDHIAVALQKTGPVPAGRSALFEAIPLRQSTRSVYDGRPVPGGELRQLTAAGTGAGVTPVLYTGAAMVPLLEYVVAGNERQLTDDAFKSELVSWIRFNDGEALASCDGLLSRGSGNPSLPRWVANLFIGRALRPAAQSEKDAAHIRSSAGLLLFASATDDRPAWLEAGRAAERFALLATTLNLKCAYLNQPCEVPAVRAQVQAQLGLNGAFPQLLLRFGHGPALPRSLRRPVNEVLITTAS
ncbi:Acg family FMN-binding oxidoreductase [Hymenobacter sp.]|uniref:Acg family FMN-binding oxidoreductase n=1 Tax=Hymenobacter sp. TaxID=1898978 RepID=UPI00286C7E9E|nr:twin-arginine translocation signal domain-containing protein [Hymenobacter sp.]